MARARSILRADPNSAMLLNPRPRVANSNSINVSKFSKARFAMISADGRADRQQRLAMQTRQKSKSFHSGALMP